MTTIPIYHQFLGRHKLPKLTEEKIDNLNRSTPIKKLNQSIVYKPSHREKLQAQTAFTGTSTKQLMKKS